MSRDELQELAALYAVDLLEGEELRKFEKELSVNPEARMAVEEYSQTADVIALTAEEVEPPADLEDRIFAQISERAEVGSAAVAGGDSKVVRGGFAWMPWGVAACFAAASLVLWNQRSELSTRFETELAEQAALVAALRDEYTEQSEMLKTQYAEQVETLRGDHLDLVESLRGEYSEQIESLHARYGERIGSLVAEVQALESEGTMKNLRIAVLKSQVESAPDAQAVAIWNAAEQSGRLAVSGLPAVGVNQDYQLWIIDPAYESPISAGVFNTDSEGGFEYSFSGSESISTIDAFALSVESKGGNDAPTGPIVLVGN